MAPSVSASGLCQLDRRALKAWPRATKPQFVYHVVASASSALDRPAYSGALRKKALYCRYAFDMARALNIDGRTLGELDDLVANGRFNSREDAVREAVRPVWEEDASPLGEAERAGIERGLADVAAGRVFDHDQVFDELERRCIDDR